MPNLNLSHAELEPSEQVLLTTNGPLAYAGPLTPPQFQTTARRFRAMSRFLHVSAVLLGLMTMLVAAVLAEVASVAASNATANADALQEFRGVIIAILAALGITAILLVVAGVRGIHDGYSGRLLLFAATAFAVTRIMIGLLLVYILNGGTLRNFDGEATLLAAAGQVALSLTFPVLCAVGVFALRAQERRGDDANGPSPWTGLGRTVGCIAVVAGALLLARYAGSVIENRRYGSLQALASRTAEESALNFKHAAEWRLTCSASLLLLLFLVGGLAAVYNPRLGRAPILLGAIGVLICWIMHFIELTRQTNPSSQQMTQDVNDILMMFAFLPFALIVLLCCGLSRAHKLQIPAVASPT